MQQVLVTGGSGYLASFCIAPLLEQGLSVRTTVRNLAREGEVRAAISRLVVNQDKLSFVAADLNSDDGWAAAAAGCQGVLHVASPFHAQTTAGDEFTKTATDGALRVIEAALAAGAERIVLTSSIAAVSPEEIPTDRLLDERDWTDPASPRISPYARSKTVAESKAWEAVRARGADKKLAVVNPGGIFGPVLGKDYSFSLRLIERLLKGDMPGVPKLGFNIVDVRDTADLHIRALMRDAAGGERFVASAGFMWIKEIADLLRREMGPMGAKVPTREAPSAMVRFMSLFDREVRSITPELGRKKAHSGDKARHTLGWAPRPMAETILDCARSMIDEGIVPKAAA
ncbi:MAG TPA: NAD-dependent epimerase/dehydratase family protein [Caulobacteraceae bacterium]|nr:NAD-dependent epimerase/dehydratase family protein [Caulobacteraceae bacterium]